MPSLVRDVAVFEGQEPRCGDGKCLVIESWIGAFDLIGFETEGCYGVMDR